MKIYLKKSKTFRILSAYFIWSLIPSSYHELMANPQNGQALVGNFSMNANGLNSTIKTTTENTAIRWDKFNILTGEHTHFDVPSARSIVLNEVLGGGASIIDGRLTSRGNIVVLNRDGVLIGRNASIDTARFAAVAGSLDEMQLKANFKESGKFNVLMGIGSVFNYGQIKTAQDGFVALLGRSAENYGKISAPSGQVIVSGYDGQHKLTYVGDGLLNFAINTSYGAVIGHRAQVDITAAEATHIVNNVINLTGYKEAQFAKYTDNGDIILTGKPGKVSAGTINVKGDKKAGKVILQGSEISLDKGSIDLSAKNYGGTLEIGVKGKHQNSRSRRIEVNAGFNIDASITAQGKAGNVELQGEQVIYNGNILANAIHEQGVGGHVKITADQATILGAVNTEGKTGKYSGLLELEVSNAFMSTALGANLSPQWLNEALKHNNVSIAANRNQGQFLLQLPSGLGIFWNNDHFLKLAGKWVDIHGPITNAGKATVEITGYGQAIERIPIGFGASGKVTTSGGSVRLYYNPLDYSQPVDFSRSLNAPEAIAYMWLHTPTDLNKMHLNRAGNYALANDINLQNASNSYLPIGGTMEYMYLGNFDGRGHTIRNLTIDIQDKATLMSLYHAKGIELGDASEHAYAPSKDAYSLGFIGYATGLIQRVNFENMTLIGGDNVIAGPIGTILHGGKVEHVKVKNITISSRERSFVGGIVGDVESASFNNASVEGFSIRAGRSSVASAAAGYINNSRVHHIGVYGYSKSDKMDRIGSVEVGDSYGEAGEGSSVGLFAGSLKASQVEDIVVSGHVKTGNVDTYAGLFAGQIMTSIVTQGSAYGRVEGGDKAKVGGFTAFLEQSRISWSHVEGEAKGGRNQTFVGGFVSMFKGMSSVLENNYANTEISVGDGGVLGGFIAMIGPGNTVRNNIVSGHIVSDKKLAEGGFIGVNLAHHDKTHPSIIENNYYDSSIGAKHGVTSFGFFLNKKLKPTKGIKKLSTDKMASVDASTATFKGMEFITLGKNASFRHTGESKWIKIPGLRPMHTWEFPVLESDGYYGIHTPHQLQLMALEPSLSYKLRHDIALEMDRASIWGAKEGENKGWQPIGDVSAKGAAFTGIFDGDNHQISGLRVFVKSKRSSGGMFGSVSGAIIKNVKFDDIELLSTKDSTKMGLIGTATNSDIENVSVSGKLKTKNSGIAGFIVGDSEGSRILFSKVDGDIETGKKSISGGLAGQASDTFIYASYADINRKKVGSKAISGGIVGKVAKGASDATSIKEVYVSGVLAKSKKDSIIGGLIGEGTYTNISSSYWHADKGFRDAIGKSSDRQAADSKVKALTADQIGLIQSYDWNFINQQGSGHWIMADKPRLAQENTKLLRTAIDMQLIWADPQGSYEVVQPIDMGLARQWNGGLGYLPPIDAVFSGRFKGNYYPITNFYSAAHDRSLGLLGNTYHANVSEVILSGEIKTGDNPLGTGLAAGLLAANSVTTMFADINVSGTIQSGLNYITGGVVGLLDKDSSLTRANTSVKAILNDGSIHGSLIGVNYGNVTKVSSRESKVETKTVPGHAHTTAGLLLGRNEQVGNVSDFYVVSSEDLTSTNLGGVVGNNAGTIAIGYVDQNMHSKWNGIAIGRISGNNDASGNIHNIVLNDVNAGVMNRIDITGGGIVNQVQVVNQDLMKKQNTFVVHGFDFNTTWNMLEDREKPFFRYEFLPIYGEAFKGQSLLKERVLNLVIPNRFGIYHQQLKLKQDEYHFLVPRAGIPQGNLIVLHGAIQKGPKSTLLTRYDQVLGETIMDMSQGIKLYSNSNLPFNVGHLFEAKRVLLAKNVKEKSIQYNLTQPKILKGYGLHLKTDFIVTPSTPYVMTGDITSTSNLLLDGPIYLANSVSVKADGDIIFNDSIYGFGRDLTVESKGKMVMMKGAGANRDGMGALTLKARKGLTLHDAIRAMKDIDITGQVDIPTRAYIVSGAANIRIRDEINGQGKFHAQAREDLFIDSAIGGTKVLDTIEANALNGVVSLPQNVHAENLVWVGGNATFPAHSTVTTNNGAVIFRKQINTKKNVVLKGQSILLGGEVHANKFKPEAQERLFINANITAKSRVTINNTMHLIPDQAEVEAKKTKMALGDLENGIKLRPADKNKHKDYALLVKQKIGPDFKAIQQALLNGNIANLFNGNFVAQAANIAPAQLGGGIGGIVANGLMGPNLFGVGNIPPLFVGVNLGGNVFGSNFGNIGNSNNGNMNGLRILGNNNHGFAGNEVYYRLTKLKDIPGIRILGPNGQAKRWDLGNFSVDTHVGLRHGELADDDYYFNKQSAQVSVDENQQPILISQNRDFVNSLQAVSQQGLVQDKEPLVLINTAQLDMGDISNISIETVGVE